MLSPRLLILGLALASTLPAAPAGPAGEPQVYREVAGRTLRLYVVRPEGWSAADRRPAIVFFHGGGWVGGSPAQFDGQARYFASRGLVCVNVEYRLLRRDGTEPPVDCIQDARTALRWVRRHAGELGVDPGRIAAAGGSAGGHLAAHAGLVNGGDAPTDDLGVPARPDALLLFNPVLENGAGGWGTARVRDRYPEFSPAHNVSRGAPPAIVFLGTKDALIPVATLEKFKAAMNAAGVRCDLHLYEGEPHGFFNASRSDGKYYRLTVIAADRFLASLGWLRGEPTLSP